MEIITKIQHWVKVPARAAAFSALLSASLLGFGDSAWAMDNACDLNKDGVINVTDVNLAVNMVLGTEPCTANLTGAGVCNAVTVQRVVNAALGEPCVSDALYPAGLFAGYSFSEGTGTTVADVSGNGHTGTLFNAAWTSAGKYGNALSFNGTTSYVNVGTFDVSGQGLTISAWFKADSYPGGYPRVLSKATGTAESDHYFMLSTAVSNGNKLRFRLKTNGVTKTLVASSGDLPTGTWVHAAATYDGSTMRLYKDGVEVGRTSMTGSMTTNSNVPVWIGRNPDNTYAFHGVIDEVRVYNRALSVSEIQDDMNMSLDGAILVPPSTPSASSVSLTWEPSISPGVIGYNVYRGTTSGGPYTKLNASLVSTASYLDNSVQAGQTYFYVATTIDDGGRESTYSNQASAVVP